MIATVDISIQAANPSLPLFSMRAFEGSPSSIRIRNVPKRIGDWVIDKVYFAVTYPDNSNQTIECKLVGGVYVGTIAGCDTIGNVKNGYSIFADGKDENGNAITDYCLGKGDVQILDARGITHPLQNTTFVQILSAHPTIPNDGDMWYENDAWYVWQNGQAMPLGDDSAIIGNLSERVDELSAELSGKQDELTEAEQYALSDTVYDLATKFYFTDNTTSAFSWNKAEITLEDFIEAGLVDENGTWIKQPRTIEVGKPVSYFHANAFAGCTNLNSVVFYGAIAVNFKRNYPWGISNTSIIQPFYNASRYWVEQQGYALTYPYQNVGILPFGTRVATLQPYTVNNLNFNSQAATFRVDVGGSAGKMRDMYFVFTVPSNTQSMTWNTYIDKFQGGDSSKIVPTSGTNIYHIYEYTSGHFAVEKFDNAYTKSQVDSKLNDYEPKANLTSDVSAIVTETSPVAEFIFEFVSGNPVDISLYRAEKMDASDEPRYNIYYGNTLAITGVLLADDMSYPYQVQDDLNGCIIDVTKTTEIRNVFGFASYDQLLTKQDKLTDTQISAIDSVVDARTTKVKYQDNATSSFNIVGELKYTSIPNISAVTEVDIGNSVSSIGSGTFNGCYSLVRVSIPDSVTHISGFAFWACSSLVSVDIPDSVIEIGGAAFQRCFSLSSAHIGTGLTATGIDTLFSGCSSLTSMTIPYSIENIRPYTFQGCGINNVTIPNSVKYIGNGAFATCNNLTSITLPNSVTGIGYGTFSGCTSLSSMTIPESVTSVGGIAFQNCSSLTSIVVKGKTQAEAEAMLAGADVPEGCTITTWNDASQEWVKEYIAQYLQEHQS